MGLLDVTVCYWYFQDETKRAGHLLLLLRYWTKDLCIFLINNTVDIGNKVRHDASKEHYLGCCKWKKIQNDKLLWRMKKPIRTLLEISEIFNKSIFVLFLSSGRSFASVRASRSHYVWLSVCLSFCGIFHAWPDEYKTHVRGIFHTCLCDIPPIHKTSFSRQDGLGTVNPHLLRPGCHGLIRSWNQGSSFGFDIIYLK